MQQPIPNLTLPAMKHKNGCSTSIRMVLVVDFHGMYFFIKSGAGLINFRVHLRPINIILGSLMICHMTNLVLFSYIQLY